MLIRQMCALGNYDDHIAYLKVICGVSSYIDV